MTVADLIAELQRYPAHKPVRLMIDSFVVETEIGDKVVFGPGEALDIDFVAYEGSYVEINAR